MESIGFRIRQSSPARRPGIRQVRWRGIVTGFSTVYTYATKGGTLANGPAEQAEEGQVGVLAEDAPEGDLDTGEGADLYGLIRESEIDVPWQAGGPGGLAFDDGQADQFRGKLLVDDRGRPVAAGLAQTRKASIRLDFDDRVGNMETFALRHRARAGNGHSDGRCSDV